MLTEAQRHTIDQDVQLIEIHRAARAHAMLARAIARHDRELFTLTDDHPAILTCSRYYSTSTAAMRRALALEIDGHTADKHHTAGTKEGQADAESMTRTEIANLIRMYAD